MNQLRPDNNNTLSGTTSNGRFVVTVTSTSVDRALAEMQLRLPDTTREHVLDPDYWMRRYGGPDTVYDLVYDRGIECIIMRQEGSANGTTDDNQHPLSGDDNSYREYRHRDELSA